MTPLRPLNLKIAVMVRVALGALACSLIAAGLVTSQARTDMNRSLAAKAALIERSLALRTMGIDAGFALQGRFPDWELIGEQTLEEGFCIEFANADGRVAMSRCRGADSQRHAAPQWFLGLYRMLFAPDRSARRPVEVRGVAIGSVEVSLDPAVGAARAWAETRHIMPFTLGAVAFLCLIVYLAIDRALRPAQVVLAGLERLAGGDLSYRLPQVRLIELGQITALINKMTASLESAIADKEELARRLATAQEEERRHLARELHDEFGQSLAAVNAIAASVEATAETACPSLVPEARTLSQIAMKMMEGLRLTLAGLRPAIVDEIGLVDSLRALVFGWNGRQAGESRFAISVTGSFHDLPDAVAVNVFRIAQEGLTNAAKHARARNVELTLERLRGGSSTRWPEGAVLLRVEDDGRGCPRDNTGSGGTGLAGIRERAAMFGGCVAMESTLAGGTRLSVTIPVGRTAQEAA